MQRAPQAPPGRRPRPRQEPDPSHPPSVLEQGEGGRRLRPTPPNGPVDRRPSRHSWTRRLSGAPTTPQECGVRTHARRHAHADTCMHTHPHTYACTQTRTYMLTHARTTHVHARRHTHTHARTCMQICTRRHTHARTHAGTHTHPTRTHAYTETHAGTHVHTHAHTQWPVPAVQPERVKGNADLRSRGP